MKCYNCENKIEGDVYTGDIGTPLEGRSLCEECYENGDPCAVVFYNQDDAPHRISTSMNETDGEFRVKWRSTDPWRGFYKAYSDNYTPLNSAQILNGHPSQEMLAEFDERTKELFDENGIDNARAFSRSSNPNVHHFDIYARNDQVPIAEQLVNEAKKDVDYDNPKWYRNILFDESTLNILSRLFPERKIQTDFDAASLVDEYGPEIMDEVRKRVGRGSVV